MSYYCVAAGCTNVPDAMRNISFATRFHKMTKIVLLKRRLHQIRSYKTLRLEIAWTGFVGNYLKPIQAISSLSVLYTVGNYLVAV